MGKFVNLLALIFLLEIVSFCQGATIEEMLNNPALVQKQIQCVLDKGPCDAIGSYLKGTVSRALGNNCFRCSRQEVTALQKISAFMSQRYPREWREINQKYSKSYGR